MKISINQLKAAAALAIVATIGFFGAGRAVAQDCTQLMPCEKLIQLIPGYEGAHLEYGDELTLSYNGAVLKLLPGEDVKWQNEIVLNADTEFVDGEIRLVWRFQVTVSDHDTSSSHGANHMGGRMWRELDDEGFVYMIELMTADGDRHGGTAHYR